jgi:hypothetical protein
MDADRVTFLAPELARWDSIEDCDALVVSIFSDERPLRGAAGLLDWRMAGRLTRWIRTGRLSGAAGEAVLFPPARKLRVGRVVVLGLGPARAFDDPSYRELVRGLANRVRLLGVRKLAMALPGRATGRIGARRAIEILLEEWRETAVDLVIIEAAAGQKEMAEALRGQR